VTDFPPIDVADLRPEILKILGLTNPQLYMGVGKDYPECLCLVVLEDVGPSKMTQVCDLLRQKGNEQWRLCANILEKKHAHLFTGMGFDAAWEESWNLCIATVRMG